LWYKFSSRRVIAKDLRILETQDFYIEKVEYPIKGNLAILSHDNLGVL